MLFSQAQGRRVVSTGTADTVGHVHGFVIDPAHGQIVAIELKTKSEANLLRWVDITAFGADVVTVAGVEKLTAADEQLTELNDKSHSLHKKKVLSTHGRQLGIMQDVDFDTTDGHIVELVLDGERVTGDRMLGAGSYAVVVRA